MRIKRWVCALLCLALLLGVLPEVRAAEVSGNFEYKRNANGSVTITGCRDLSLTELVIPAEIEGRPVHAIADTAFEKCTKLRRLVVSEGVEEIGMMAFSTPELRELVLPASLRRIGSSNYFGDGLEKAYIYTAAFEFDLFQAKRIYLPYALIPILSVRKNKYCPIEEFGFDPLRQELFTRDGLTYAVVDGEACLVEAQPEKTDREALLLLINEIRREACEEGVDSPVDGRPLTPADYVPLQWSEALEEIALQRAAESMILQDHTRPDGTECFTVAPEGVSFTTETLAWGFEDAEEALKGWYSEKASYLNADGGPAGHYMALINPENRLVGIAGLSARWQRNACAGAFGRDAGSGEASPAAETDAGKGGAAAPFEEAPEESQKDKEWRIPVRRDYLPAVIERAVEITVGRIRRSALF